ncbi:putative non-specific serine/threonine protein kinase [Helianthus anomalus]
MVNTLTLSQFVGRVPSRNEKYANEIGKEDKELSSYSLSIIANSTYNFSLNNKLGEGGFGSVYKVILSIYVHVTLKLSKDYI